MKDDELFNDGVSHDKAPYDRSRFKLTYEELEKEFDRVRQEFGKLAYENWLLKIELAKCCCGK
jgi:hypothetical protein